MKKVLNLIKIGKKDFYAGAVIGNFLYYSNWNSRGLLRADLQSAEVKLLTLFESDNPRGLYRFAFSVENQIWFVPCALEDKIAVYHVNEERLEYLVVPKAEYLGQYELFKDYYVVGREVWLIPYSYDVILKINIDDKKIVRLEDMRVSSVRNGKLQYIKSCKYEEKVFLCPWEYDRVGVVNMDTLEMMELDYNIPQKTFRNILVINRKIYLIPIDITKGLLEYDLLTGEWSTIELGKNLSGEYYAVYYDENNRKLVLFPYMGCDILTFNVNTWERDCITINVEGKRIIENPYWCEVREFGKQIWVIAEERGMSELIYDKKGSMRSFVPPYSENIVVSEIIWMINRNRSLRKFKRNVGATIYEEILGKSRNGVDGEFFCK